MTIFDCILETIFRLENIDESHQADFLVRLRPFAQTLWRSYRNDQIEVDYKNRGFQYAYLLRYFPFYIGLFGHLIRKTGATYTRDNSLKSISATFFGGGPGPEVIGLLDFLYRQNRPHPNVTANIIDVYSDDWSEVRTGLFQTMVEAEAEFLSNSPQIVDLQADLSSSEHMNKPEVLDSLKSSEFVMFQNCLNEMSGDGYVANILEAVENSQTGTALIIIERSGYPLENLNSLLNALENSWEILVKEDQKYDCGPMLNQCPKIVTDNLFCPPDENLSWANQLIYAKNVRYHGVLGKKK